MNLQQFRLLTKGLPDSTEIFFRDAITGCVSPLQTSANVIEVAVYDPNQPELSEEFLEVCVIEKQKLPLPKRGENNCSPQWN